MYCSSVFIVDFEQINAGWDVICTWAISDQFSHHIKTNQLNYFANQLTGFFIIQTSILNRIKCYKKQSVTVN